MSGARHHPWGRLRKRLARLIEAHGFRVVRLHAAQGYVRAPRGTTGEWDDCYRWEGYVRRADSESDLEFHIGSFDTMTECVRYGLRIERDGSSYEAHSKKGERA